MSSEQIENLDDELDQIDYSILDLLQHDARTTQVRIAGEVGLSQPAVAERIKKLEERRAIVGWVARLDPRRMGNDIRAFVGVRISHPRHHEAFTRALRDIPEVLECHRVAGQDSYLLKVVTRNTGTLDQLLSGSLRRLAGVTSTQTTIVLSTLKEESCVPLPRAQLRPPRQRRKEG